VVDITVDHLLTHIAGGWAADSNDPMMHNSGWSQETLITSTENVALTSTPGTQWAYSNFGYCLLGRIIEQVTGQSYETYVQANILARCESPICRSQTIASGTVPPMKSCI
jgi:CubicO group peptidase (beta-lactamase class C family)